MQGGRRQGLASVGGPWWGMDLWCGRRSIFNSGLGSSRVALPTKDMAIQRETAVVICLNGQGFPTVLERGKGVRKAGQEGACFTHYCAAAAPEVGRPSVPRADVLALHCLPDHSTFPAPYQASSVVQSAGNLPLPSHHRAGAYPILPQLHSDCVSLLQHPQFQCTHAHAHSKTRQTHNCSLSLAGPLVFPRLKETSQDRRGTDLTLVTLHMKVLIQRDYSHRLIPARLRHDGLRADRAPRSILPKGSESSSRRFSGSRHPVRHLALRRAQDKEARVVWPQGTPAYSTHMGGASS